MMNSQKPWIVWLALVSMTIAAPVCVGVAQEKPATQQNQNKEIDLDDLLAKAIEEINREEYKSAKTKLKQYTDAQQNNTQAWFLFGYSQHMSGEIDGAIKAFEKAIPSPSLGQVALYNLGCAYSLKENPDKSLTYLHKALDAGFDDFTTLKSDADLANVRQADGFKEILARVENNGKRPKQNFDPKSLIGQWMVTSGTRQGNEVAKERLPEITFTAKDVTIPAGPQKFVMSYTIADDSKDIVELDFKIESGPAPDGSALAILKIEGETAKLCYDPTGKKRPTEFSSTAEDGNFCFVMKKKAAQFDATQTVGVWNVIEGSRAGNKVAADRLAESKITFTSENITIPAGDTEFVMSYEFKDGTNPIQVDMKIESGPAPAGAPALGIVKFDGEKFIICYNAMGGERPESFEATKANGNHLFTMTKE